MLIINMFLNPLILLFIPSKMSFMRGFKIIM